MSYYCKNKKCGSFMGSWFEYKSSENTPFCSKECKEKSEIMSEIKDKNFAERFSSFFKDLEKYHLDFSTLKIRDITKGTFLPGLFLEIQDDGVYPFYYDIKTKKIHQQNSILEYSFVQKIKEYNDFKAKLIGLGFEVLEK